MIAAAGPTEGLQPRAALLLLACIAVCLTMVLLLTPSTTILGKVPLRASPEELSIRARDVARRLGFTDIAADVLAGFDYDAGYLQRMAPTIDGSDSARRLQWDARLASAPWPIWFTHVQSPGRLTPRLGNVVAALPVTDDGLLDPGRITTTLDLEGRLLSIERTPTPADIARPPTGEPDWTALFMAAGLDIRRFSQSSAEPRLEIADYRVAWTGPYLDANQTAVRIEASAFRGVVSSFAVIFPTKATSQTSGAPFYLIFVIGLSLLGLLHLTQGRGDTRSAWRYGLYAAVLALAVGLLVPRPYTSLIIFGSAGAGAIAALMYLAIEPWTRRLWPHVMITWARLLAGRWRDPVVGRDVLVVVACVTLNYAVQRIVVFAAVQAGAVPHAVNYPDHFGVLLDSLANIRVLLANLILPFLFGLTVGMGLFLTLFVCNALVRRKWIAAGLALLLWFAGNPGVFVNWMDTLQWGLEFAFLLFLTLQFGVFASVLFSCLSMLIDWSMFTSDFSAWYGRPSLAATLILAVLTLYAFRTSIGRRPVLGSLMVS
jgi:hypothetical protein